MELDHAHVTPPAAGSARRLRSLSGRTLLLQHLRLYRHSSFLVQVTRRYHLSIFAETEFFSPFYSFNVCACSFHFQFSFSFTILDETAGLCSPRISAMITINMRLGAFSW
jgi:hypothetical protein